MSCSEWYLVNLLRTAANFSFHLYVAIIQAVIQLIYAIPFSHLATFRHWLDRRSFVVKVIFAVIIQQINFVET